MNIYKDASMFDLTCHTSTQRHDRLLPLLRCESRLEETSADLCFDAEMPVDFQGFSLFVAIFEN